MHETAKPCWLKSANPAANKNELVLLGRCGAIADIASSLGMISSIMAALAASTTPGPAVATDTPVCGHELICAADPQTVVAALQKRGFRAELFSDPAGPYIASGAEGYAFSVLFNDCKDGKDCTSLQFNILFSESDKHTPQYANAFNVRYRYIQVGALPNNRLRFAYDLNTMGGITKENFNTFLGIWSGALRSFANFSREQAASTIPPAAPINPVAGKPQKP